MTRPLILGLTGSIGMGKSTVAAMFDELGVPVFDADAIVHRLQGARSPLLNAIEQAFPGTTGPEGLDRERMASAVFGDAAALARLEAIMHPAVRAARAEFLLEHADAPLVVFDIPLLFEKGGIEDIDRVAVVSAPADVQLARVLGRPGMTAERFARILQLQMPDSEKRALADYIIDTGTPLAATRARISELVEELTR